MENKHKTLFCTSTKYKTTILALDEIYSLNDNLQDKAFEKKLYTSLRLKGMLNPLLVCTEETFKNSDIRKFEGRPVQPEIDQAYRCLIGNNRYKFAVDNGYTHIETLIVESFEEVKRLHKETEIEPRRM